MQPCKKTIGRKGFLVEAESGDGTSTICTIGYCTDVKHIVKITNLRLYPAAITCQGLIQANPRKVEFSSSQPGDSATYWSAVASHLHSGCAPQVFNHVTILSKSPGPEQVLTEVTVKWAQPGLTETINVPITVTG